MAQQKQPIDWTTLWKKDDWMSVWIGFLILIFFLAGATFKLPGWKWMTDGAFLEKAAGQTSKVGSLAKNSEAKGEEGVKTQALALKAAIDGKDRKAIGDAAGKLEKAAKDAKDKDIKKSAEKLGKDIKGDAGATVGKILGAKGMMKGGVALSTVTVGDGVTVSALSVANAFGDVVDETGSVLAGARQNGRFVGSTRLLLSMPAAPDLAPLNDTTLSVVMTDGRLDKLQCAMVARMAHDGQARAVDPIHTPVDGDCVFVLATGQKDTNVFQVGVAAAEAVAMSIRRAARCAGPLGGATAVSELA